MSGITVQQSIMNQAGIKIARLIELFNGKIAKNESLDDTIKDLINYLVLLKQYMKFENDLNNEKIDDASK